MSITTTSFSSARLRAFAAAVIAVLAAAFLAACSPTSTPSESAAPGNSPDAPRIVALDWRYEEILDVLGVQPAGIVEIGKSAAPTTLEGKLEGVASVGQAKQPNLEVIASLQPDLILASPTRHEAIMHQLGEIAETRSYADTSYTDVLDSMDEIAAYIGGEAPQRAAKARQRIETKLAEAKQSVEPGTRAALVGWSDDQLYTWIAASFPGSLLSSAGYEYGYDGERSAIESKTDVAQLTGDKLPGMNLDVLYLYNDIEGFKATPFAAAVPDIVDVDQDVWSRSRGPIAAETMLDQIINQQRQ